MRILHAFKIFRPDIEGGIPEVISSLAHASADGVTHSIVCARSFGMARRYHLQGIPVEAVASLGTLFSTPLAPAYIPAMIRQARSADVVVHHAPLPLSDAAILLGLPDKVALIVYWHAEIARYRLLKSLISPLIRRVLLRADRIVVSGQQMIDQSDFLRLHADKCSILPYGVNLDDWIRPQATLLQGILAPIPRHIVALGRLVGYKGFDVLIRAMRHIDGQLTIIGGGPLHQQLQHLAIELGVADRVRLTGRLDRSDITRLLHAAQVFAFPSVTEAEAFGIVQVEAMAAGLPIVNTSLATNVPLVARHEQEALTVVPRDPEALAEAINRLLNDPALAQRLGAAGIQRARDEYDQSVFQARMSGVYELALQARRDRVINGRG